MLDTKVAIVTGGCSGIGLAVVKAFLHEGAYVVVADCCSNGLDIINKLPYDRTRLRFIKTNVAKEADIKKMINYTIQSFGTVDIAVACAGIPGDGNILNQDLDKWHQLMSVDLDGVFLLGKHVLSYMVKHHVKGSIINIASIGGMVGFPHDVSYSAAKGAVINLTRSEAVKVADAGIRVNAIAPGYIHTPMLDNIPNSQAIIKEVANLHPMHRIGEPDEVASVCVFLASNQASFITGAVIPVDGGYTCI